MNDRFANPRPTDDAPSWRERLAESLRVMWRRVRIDRRVTALLGPQYRRSRDAIEIDITWACNLRCHNCNRSVRQAPTSEQMSAAQVRAFIDESRHAGARWRKVRLVGGEPTIHPEFSAIVEMLRAWRAEGGVREIQVATNGYGEAVQRALATLPTDITVDNSAKTGNEQPHFGDFNVAPRDLPEFARADFRNACWVAEGCGMGLTPYGYYPCAVAGGIDRVLGLGLGRASLPARGDEMSEELAALCQWCGRFKAGHFVPRKFRLPLYGEPNTSSWREAYARWRKQRPSLKRYGEP